jgi:twitching motility protein PilT
LARFRVSIFKQRGNISMVLRQIPNDKLTPEQLGLADSVVEMVQRPRGLVLVTGPTGSGKSTTLASLGQLFERDARSPHHHHRGSDRVLSRPHQVDDQSA